jgi:hypothetical protein
MAEDQGVNGTTWNKEAVELLSLFGWETIGDYDMDVEGEDGKDYGLDSIMKFNTPLKPFPQAIILEAKRYEAKNFNQDNLQKWITRLDKKLLELKNSEPFKQQFPVLEECSNLDTGIIAIWFHDVDNYKSFHSKFVEILQKIKISNRQRRAGCTRIFVIDNYNILKLCSLQNAIKAYETENKNSKVEFYYPSILIDEEPIAREKALSIEYILSNIILAEPTNSKENLVFYFGESSLDCLKQLRNLLSKCSVLDKNKSLKLFVYQKDDNFRKIDPEIKKLFENITFEIKSMDNLNDLPAYIKDITHE